MTPKQREMVVKLESVINRSVPKSKRKERPNLDPTLDGPEVQVKEIDKPLDKINQSALMAYAIANKIEARNNPAYERIFKSREYYMTFLVKIKKQRCAQFEQFVTNKIEASVENCYEGLYNSGNERVNISIIIEEYVRMFKPGDKWQGLEELMEKFLTLPASEMTASVIKRLMVCFVLYRACALETGEFEQVKNYAVRGLTKYLEEPVAFIAPQTLIEAFGAVNTMCSMFQQTEKFCNNISLSKETEQLIIDVNIKLLKLYHATALDRLSHVGCDLTNLWIIRYFKEIKKNVWPELWQAADNNIKSIIVPWLRVLSSCIKFKINKELISEFCNTTKELLTLNSSSDWDLRQRQHLILNIAIKAVKAIQDRNESVEQILIQIESEDYLNEYIEVMRDIKRSGYVLSK